MPQAPVVTSSTAGSPRALSPPFDCTWKTGSSAAWVHVAGELDLATSPELSQALQEALLQARLVVLDLRELTFMDSSGLHVILDAAGDARREGGRVILVRGCVQVDRVFTLTGASDEVLIFDLDPTEPSQALFGDARSVADFDPAAQRPPTNAAPGVESIL